MENPRDGEPGGLPSTGSSRVGQDCGDSVAAANPPISLVSRITSTTIPQKVWQREVEESAQSHTDS